MALLDWLFGTKQEKPHSSTARRTAAREPGPSSRKELMKLLKSLPIRDWSNLDLTDNAQEYPRNKRYVSKGLSVQAAADYLIGAGSNVDGDLCGGIFKKKLGAGFGKQFEFRDVVQYAATASVYEGLERLTVTVALRRSSAAYDCLQYDTAINWRS
jgi:hypothetical protein